MRIIFALLIVTESLVLVISSLILASVIPHLHRCSRHQSDLNKCIARSIESLRPYLVGGISYLNIPSFEPLYKEHYEFIQHNAKFNGSAKFTNLMIYGVSNFTIHKVRHIIDAYQIRFEAHFPLVQILGIYDINAVFLDVPILRSGYRIHANFTNTTASIILDGQYYNSNQTEEEYFRVGYMNVDFDIRNAQVYLNNIDVNDSATSTMNIFLNNNLQTMLNEMKPVLKMTVEDFFTTIANKIYSHFPTKSLFPR